MTWIVVIQRDRICKSNTFERYLEKKNYVIINWIVYIILIICSDRMYFCCAVSSRYNGPWTLMKSRISYETSDLDNLLFLKIVYTDY
jgi:hypothetical protein